MPERIGELVKTAHVENKQVGIPFKAEMDKLIDRAGVGPEIANQLLVLPEPLSDTAPPRSSITAATISPFDSRAGYRRRTDSINPVSQLSCVGVMVVQTTGQGKNPDRGGCPF